MRQSRLTYPGAYHHVMSRGINGEKIFQTDEAKAAYLEILGEQAQFFRILLVLLKDLCGMKYREISGMPVFSDVQFYSLG